MEEFSERLPEGLKQLLSSTSESRLAMEESESDLRTDMASIAVMEQTSGAGENLTSLLNGASTIGVDLDK